MKKNNRQLIVKKTRPLVPNIIINTQLISKYRVYSRLNLLTRQGYKHIKIYKLKKKEFIQL